MSRVRAVNGGEVFNGDGNGGVGTGESLSLAVRTVGEVVGSTLCSSAFEASVGEYNVEAFGLSAKVTVNGDCAGDSRVTDTDSHYCYEQECYDKRSSFFHFLFSFM